MLKKIKQKILIAKIAGITFALIFVSHLGLTIYQSIQIADLKQTISEINNS